MFAIKVENLSKSYLVGHNAVKRERYTALRDVIARNVKGLARKTHDMFTGRQIVQGDEVEEFWALKDINFEVHQGDRIGIIGRNGAGKSTLLKVLSRITEPTRGRVTLNGRVASLLEVGTGFHPELSGRENIYLNGAILGMTRMEIQQKFDEIVDFAEVEKFLDTPVKRYSSGMYVRLAFAVAAHLEPEILLVDEVLAVGDVAFQKKCLGKMEDIASQGRTVLFVSHNLGSIRSLCDAGILLVDGTSTFYSNINNCIEEYSNSFINGINQKVKYIKQILNINLPIEILSVKIDQMNNFLGTFDTCQPIIITMEYLVRRRMVGSIVHIKIRNSNNDIFWSFDTDKSSELIENREPGHYRSEIIIPKYLLKPDSYSLRFGSGIANSNSIEDVKENIIFSTDILSEDSSHKSYSNRRDGVVGQALLWNTNRLKSEILLQ